MKANTLSTDKANASWLHMTTSENTLIIYSCPFNLESAVELYPQRIG